MKYLKLYTTVICSLVFLNVSATETPSKVKFGLKLAPTFNWSRIIEGKVTNNGAKLGFSYGIMMDFNIAKNPNYWFSTEILVQDMPTKIAASNPLSITPNGGITQTYNDVKIAYKNKFVYVPLTLKLKTNEIGNFTYHAQIGGGLGVSASTRATTTTSNAGGFYSPTSGITSHSPNSSGNDDLDFNGDASNNNSGAFEDNVVPVRVAMIIGLGAETKISGNTVVNFGVRFDNGILDYYWDNKTKGRLNGLGLHVGVFF